jgi:hypothetical protein
LCLGTLLEGCQLCIKRRHCGQEANGERREEPHLLRRDYLCKYLRKFKLIFLTEFRHRNFLLKASRDNRATKAELQPFRSKWRKGHLRRETRPPIIVSTQLRCAKRLSSPPSLSLSARITNGTTSLPALRPHRSDGLYQHSGNESISYSLILEHVSEIIALEFISECRVRSISSSARNLFRLVLGLSGGRQPGLEITATINLHAFHKRHCF